jgi:hypothetical protein
MFDRRVAWTLTKANSDAIYRQTTPAQQPVVTDPAAQESKPATNNELVNSILYGRRTTCLRKTSSSRAMNRIAQPAMPGIGKTDCVDWKAHFGLSVLVLVVEVKDYREYAAAEIRRQLLAPDPYSAKRWSVDFGFRADVLSATRNFLFPEGSYSPAQEQMGRSRPTRRIRTADSLDAAAVAT